jgi:hypothetical protein
MVVDVDHTLEVRVQNGAVIPVPDLARRRHPTMLRRPRVAFVASKQGRLSCAVRASFACDRAPRATELLMSNGRFAGWYSRLPTTRTMGVATLWLMWHTAPAAAVPEHLDPGALAGLLRLAWLAHGSLHLDHWIHELTDTSSRNRRDEQTATAHPHQGMHRPKNPFCWCSPSALNGAKSTKLPRARLAPKCESVGAKP